MLNPAANMCAVSRHTPIGRSVHRSKINFSSENVAPSTLPCPAVFSRSISTGGSTSFSARLNALATLEMPAGIPAPVCAPGCNTRNGNLKAVANCTS